MSKLFKAECNTLWFKKLEKEMNEKFEGIKEALNFCWKRRIDLETNK